MLSKRPIVLVLLFTMFFFGSPPSGMMATKPSYLKQNMANQIEFISSLQMESGVIRNSNQYGSYDGGKFYHVQPYNANIAALAMLKDPTKIPQVKNYMAWYLKHLNWPDTSGMYGTVYDYWVDDQGREKIAVDKKTGKPVYDSVDSYSATFLMLAKAFYDAGGAEEKTFIKANKYKLDVIGNTIVHLMDKKDNLTWAKPGYPVKYLMDNSEVYRGLSDLAVLFAKMGDSGGSRWYQVYADRVKTAINTNYGLADGNWYSPAKTSNGSRSFRIQTPVNGSRNNWYPDISSQLYPILYGVISPSDPKARNIYQTISRNYSWIDLKVSKFPSVQIGYVGALMKDQTSVEKFYQNITDKYLTNFTKNKSTWNSWEAGWYVLMADKILENNWRF